MRMRHAHAQTCRYVASTSWADAAAADVGILNAGALYMGLLADPDHSWQMGFKARPAHPLSGHGSHESRPKGSSSPPKARCAFAGAHCSSAEAVTERVATRGFT